MNTTDIWTWKVVIIQDMPTNTRRVQFYRGISLNEVEVVKGFDEQGNIIVERIGEFSEFPTPGFRFPDELLSAIADQVSPRPTVGQMNEVRSALRKEQGRVDAVLQATQQKLLQRNS